jgi:hypothetical protein
MMTQSLNQYLGRIVRLNQRVFEEIKQRANRQGVALENSFLVVQVNRKINKLICYGARFRIVVSSADVVLV